MTLSRRAFLGSSAALGGALAATRLGLARGLLTDATLDDLVHRALAAAQRAGATYADVRVVRQQREVVATREARIEGVAHDETYGVGVRAIASGAWGFAAGPVVTAAAAEQLARDAVAIAKGNAAAYHGPPVALAPVPANVDVWQTPLVKDPFKIPLEDKAELLFAINRAAMAVKGLAFASSSYLGLREWKLLASTDGAYLEQQITRLGGFLTFTAIDAKRGDFVARSAEIGPRQAGWELVEDAHLAQRAPQLAEEAVATLAAPSVAPGKRDLVIAPSNLWLTIHESIGHATELDRALGFEANFAGTSYATPDQLGKLQVGAPILTFYADRTTPGALATCGYDDDGVATQRWNLVDKGVLVGYQTTREQASWIREPASRGCSYAEGYGGVPFQRMPNVSLAPGAADKSVDDLVAGVDDGFLLMDTGSWSIDQQRLNFQFGCGAAWEIKGGKRRGLVRDLAYQANTLEFWKSCDAIGGPRAWELHGSLGDGKGEPMQVNAMSHGAPPARFRKVAIVSTNRRGAA